MYMLHIWRRRKEKGGKGRGWGGGGGELEFVFRKVAKHRAAYIQHTLENVIWKSHLGGVGFRCCITAGVKGAPCTEATVLYDEEEVS